MKTLGIKTKVWPPHEINIIYHPCLVYITHILTTCSSFALKFGEYIRDIHLTGVVYHIIIIILYPLNRSKGTLKVLNPLNTKLWGFLCLI